jgi:hypothetical protein
VSDCIHTLANRFAMRFRSIAGQTTLLLRSERGDVLMEYVLLTVLIILPLVGASTGFFNPSGRTFNLGEQALQGDDFGSIGNAFVQLYRMVMCGVSLPLP